MKRNDAFSLILTLTALDNLFNVLLFLAGALFIISVIGHHHLSLIICQQSPVGLVGIKFLLSSRADFFIRSVISFVPMYLSFNVFVLCWNSRPYWQERTTFLYSGAVSFLLR